MTEEVVEVYDHLQQRLHEMEERNPSNPRELTLKEKVKTYFGLNRVFGRNAVSGQEYRHNVNLDKNFSRLGTYDTSILESLWVGQDALGARENLQYPQEGQNNQWSNAMKAFGVYQNAHVALMFYAERGWEFSDELAEVAYKAADVFLKNAEALMSNLGNVNHTSLMHLELNLEKFGRKADQMDDTMYHHGGEYHRMFSVAGDLYARVMDYRLEKQRRNERAREDPFALILGDLDKIRPLIESDLRAKGILKDGQTLGEMGHDLRVVKLSSSQLPSGVFFGPDFEEMSQFTDLPFKHSLLDIASAHPLRENDTMGVSVDSINIKMDSLPWDIGSNKIGSYDSLLDPDRIAEVIERLNAPKADGGESPSVYGKKFQKLLDDIREVHREDSTD
jgi:hypothetical protein